MLKQGDIHHMHDATRQTDELTDVFIHICMLFMCEQKIKLRNEIISDKPEPAAVAAAVSDI